MYTSRVNINRVSKCFIEEDLLCDIVLASEDNSTQLPYINPHTVLEVFQNCNLNKSNITYCLL